MPWQSLDIRSKTPIQILHPTAIARNLCVRIRCSMVIPCHTYITLMQYARCKALTHNHPVTESNLRLWLGMTAINSPFYLLRACSAAMLSSTLRKSSPSRISCHTNKTKQRRFQKKKGDPAVPILGRIVRKKTRKLCLQVRLTQNSTHLISFVRSYSHATLCTPLPKQGQLPKTNQLQNRLTQQRALKRKTIFSSSDKHFALNTCKYYQNPCDLRVLGLHSILFHC